MSPVYAPGKVVFRQTWQPMDPDASAYITAVEAADGQSLEEKTKNAIDNFVLGCKQDGIWSAVKACCILAGARTLNGALVPLVGTAPTNNNFVAGDYNRKTGLVGNGSTKYLNTNRNNNADPQNSKHISVYSNTSGFDETHIGALPSSGSGRSDLQYSNNGGTIVYANSVNDSFSVGYSAAGFVGCSRSGSTSISARNDSKSYTASVTSTTPYNGNVFVFCRNLDGAANRFSNNRLSFYSIGESLDLAKLDARVTDLINALGAAIP